MKASELREKSVDELRSQLQELYKDKFNYRMQHSTGQLGQIHLVSTVKRDIARVKTLLSEKQRGEKLKTGKQNAETQASEQNSES